MEYKIQTKLGNAWLFLNDDEHIYFSAGSNLNAFTEYSETNKNGRMGPLTINKVEYAVGAHLSRWTADGRFHIGEKNDHPSVYGDLHITRVEYWTKKGPSEAAMKIAREVIESAVNHWVSLHIPDLHEAGLQHRIKRAEAKLVDIKKLEIQLAEARIEHEKLTADVEIWRKNLDLQYPGRP